MPIEIKELYIKATVVDRQLNADQHSDMPGQPAEKLRKELVKACVQEVLQILEDKKER